MRLVQNQQMQIGEVDISQIVFDSKSRDDIPRILKGLQYIYVNSSVNEKVFKLLESELLPNVDKRNGRPGMSLWRILVCGVVKLDLNIDYDRLHELVNQHANIREILGHCSVDDKHYNLQTLKDNVRLLTPELLNNISQVVVNAGHELIKLKGSESLRGRCDSFVVETNVHFPTDISLLFDAMRKIITLTSNLCNEHGLSDWRQYAHNIQQLKRLTRSASSKKRSKAKSDKIKIKKEKLIVDTHNELLDVSDNYVKKIKETLILLEQNGYNSELDKQKKVVIESFIIDAERQIDQTRRRVILAEVIPHEEKVFSVFEKHTEWISKGKAGVPVELGLKVCVLEDQHQFILNHQVMENKTDDKVAVSMVQETLKRFKNLHACSFDKGFHSPENQVQLKNILEQVVLPKKGKLSKLAKEAEHTDAFIKAKHAHSAVESAINALEVHGLDICLDRGIDGFKRYVALAVLTRNIHRIGDILWKQERQIEQRKKNRAAYDPPYKQAA